MTFDFETRWGLQHGCTLRADRYANNNHIAISVWCEDGPYADLTVNLNSTSKWPDFYGFVDVNNFPEAEYLIKKLKIGKPVEGGFGFSGMCAYPLYRFNITKIEEYTEE